MSLRPRTVLFHERSEEFVGPLRAAIPELDLAVARDMEELAALLPEAEIVLCTCFPAEALPLAPYLRWIQLISAGVDGVLPLRDLIGDVTVTNSRGIHSELMADYTLCMMVMLQWDFPRLIRGQANGEWLREPKGALAGKTLCVLGPGAIGAEIGRRAAEFGMHVVGVRRSGTDSPPGFAEMHPSEALDAVLPRADFVCIVVPETPDTRRMIGARQLAGMKKSAFLINISRGALVDEAALISALRDGGIAGAGLDVFEREPPAPDNPLWTMPGVIMTPHISGMMDVNADRVASVFAANLRRYRGGEKMENIVDLARGY